MTATLRELFDALGESLDRDEHDEAYDAARMAKVAEIAEAIRHTLVDPDDAEHIAESIISSAEEMGRIDSDHVSGEVSGRFTKDGNPNPVIV